MDAKLSEARDDKAILHKVNGVKIAVPIRMLCIEDQDYVSSICNIKDDGVKTSSSSSTVEMFGTEASSYAAITPLM